MNPLIAYYHAPIGVLITLALLCILFLPNWPWSSGWSLPRHPRYRYRYYPSSGLGLVLIILLVLLFAGCAGQPPPTAAQVQGYANAFHTGLANGISDYKEIKRVSH